MNETVGCRWALRKRRRKGGGGVRWGRKSPPHNTVFSRGGCCEVQFFVNLESVSPKLESESTKMYFKLLSDILIYTNICTIPSI